MKKPHRRGFLKTAAVAGTAISMTAQSYGKIVGANGAARIGFIGVGGRCQQHIDVSLRRKELTKDIDLVAACDVWDGDQSKGKGKGQGLQPSAKRMGVTAADHIVKDYRKLLDLKDVDVVFIGTPDHWHAKQTIDAMQAGKHVYCEKPMTRTIAQAQAVVDTWKKTGKVMSVGVQSMADPTWLKAKEVIASGKIGHVMQAQTRYYRNSLVGQWRYYNLTKTMTPQTVDWKTFLGEGVEVAGEPLGPTEKEFPFDRAVFAQWRCYWPFGGGMFTDLFVHQVTHLIEAMGVRYPRRVVGGGGLYLEYDGRDVPDVSMVCADYDEGCQMFVTATMCNDYPIDEVIRGKTGTIKFIPLIGDIMKGFEIIPQDASGKARGPGDAQNAKGELVESGFVAPGGYEMTKDGVSANAALTYALWDNFLKCVASGNQGTLSTPELGAASFSTVNMGVQSYRNDKVVYWDKEKRATTESNGAWAAEWEKRSKARGKANQVMGWHGGDAGSSITPPEDAKLGGPWVNGQDPAGA
ncbi:Gfo/Idh/MocA family protein [Limnoglobus roseus]|uniref:Putative Rossmann-fold-type glycoside hydrolase n=1 Tax=Limnoglobus roseus TaxID=2598579 RepID=A0A5C1AA38_9BACT|nr:Gfo/Idh/MocA family oxidoreductase [Limnoglobus roseus]QEL14896.1 putative Rossmann-fold-type glycoside hydrolase [Limnoglobus roseus]